METTTSTSHLFQQTNSFDIMDSSEPTNTFLKLEDLHSSPSANFDGDATQSSQPEKLVIHSKPAKKRKSWGQELPEPTTSLPPRKRAKTDDEKEQRRIERIKRNRAAAHNSRERKRQETETLAVALARANAELDAYRSLHGPLPSHIVLPEVTVSNDSPDTPAPSLVESRGTADDAASPTSPEDSLFDYGPTIKVESHEDNFATPLPPAFDNMEAKPTLSQLEQTQHSAAMLCDLQCQLSRNKASPTPSTSWWAALFLSLIQLQLQTTYKTILMSIWTLSPSRTARLMQASTHRLTSRSTSSSMTTPPPSRRTWALAQRNAATARAQRQGALVALQRLALIEAHRMRNTAAAEQQQHQMSSNDSLAFVQDRNEESVEGENENGVGR